MDDTLMVAGIDVSKDKLDVHVLPGNLVFGDATLQKEMDLREAAPIPAAGKLTHYVEMASAIKAAASRGRANRGPGDSARRSRFGPAEPVERVQPALPQAAAARKGQAKAKNDKTAGNGHGIFLNDCPLGSRWHRI